MLLLKISFFTFQLLINVLAKRYDLRIINYVIEEYGWLVFPLTIALLIYLYIRVFDIPFSERYYIHADGNGPRCGNGEIGYVLAQFMVFPVFALLFQIVCDLIRKRVQPKA